MADTSPRPSLRGAIDRKCKECGGSEGGERRWREHVAICPIIGCALWIVRPLPERCPDWLASHNASDLPADWRSAPAAQALCLIRTAVETPETGRPMKTADAFDREGGR